MTLNLLVWVGGLLALAVAGAAARFSLKQSRQTPSEVSGEWLAQARPKEEHRW